MDTSETYIKMRRKAISDLGMGTPIDSPCTAMADDVWVDGRGNWYYATQYEVFQLERQDQLQEMVEFPVGTFKDNFWSALDDFHQWAFSENFSKWIPLSMEQLWLAFVMKKKYNKVWNGDEWIE